MEQTDFSFKSWQDYQKDLQRSAKRRCLIGRLPVLGLYAGCCFLILLSMFVISLWIHGYVKERSETRTEVRGDINVESRGLNRTDLPEMFIGWKLQTSTDTGKYLLSKEGANLTVSTSIESAFQDYTQNLLGRSKTYMAAVVVMKLHDGRILVLADYAREGDGDRENLCTKADIPAASLFKIISAASVIEARNFSPDQALYYRGGKYTLYKSQLKKGIENDRYKYKTSLRKAFSGSNNSVFGRLGIYELGREILNDYAVRFLFNTPIPFDLELEESKIDVPTDDFGLAEIASGFNKRTLISPLHANLITSSIANDGTMMKPWLVTNIRDHNGRILYYAKPSKLASPVNEETSKKMKVLMNDTVRYGTCSKTFRSLRRKGAFENIDLGAKTGTINDRLDQYKYDWLTAYAIPEEGNNGICITVLAVHDELLGIRAKDIACDLIKYYFSSKT
ncbi:MAG: hypothetical protein JW882_16370 [Deltaproteobacteria bacterium]|nr:hypothetical protein [Deltaproteobacteria bacterium]